MVTLEQLAILKSGVEHWNVWRREHPETESNLIGADLRGASLSMADFSGTILIGANLRNADLRGARLRAAVLVAADLRGTILTGADVRGACLTSAVLQDTVFGNMNLRGAIGLEACIHHGPRVLDYPTVIRSGNLSLLFLRGCGMPESLIDSPPSLVRGEPVEFYSCFIGHAAQDQHFAARLHDDLQDKGVRCWLVPENLNTADAVRLHDKLLLIFSEHSVKRDWVRDAVGAVLERERRERRPILLPVQLDHSAPDIDEAWADPVRTTRDIEDFRNWKEDSAYKKAFGKLLRDLQAMEAPEP